MRRLWNLMSGPRNFCSAFLSDGFSVGLKVLVWKNVRFCVITQVWQTSAVFQVCFQFNDWLSRALYFVFLARDVIKINHYWEKYTTSLPSFHIKEQNHWEISSLEQNYKVMYHTITSLRVVFGLSTPSTYLCALDKHVMADPMPATIESGKSPQFIIIRFKYSNRSKIPL